MIPANSPMVILSYRKDGIFEPDIPMLVVSTPLKNSQLGSLFLYMEK
jgi:hypothetical protein